MTHPQRGASSVAVAAQPPALLAAQAGWAARPTPSQPTASGGFRSSSAAAWDRSQSELRAPALPWMSLLLGLRVLPQKPWSGRDVPSREKRRSEPRSLIPVAVWNLCGISAHFQHPGGDRGCLVPGGLSDCRGAGHLPGSPTQAESQDVSLCSGSIPTCCSLKQQESLTHSWLIPSRAEPALKSALLMTALRGSEQ